MAPARVASGVSMRARYQTPGSEKPRCGSPASSGAPVAEWRASTAQALLALSGWVKGAGKRGRPVWGRAAWGGAVVSVGGPGGGGALGAGEFGAPVGGEVEAHGLGPEQRVGGGPGAGGAEEDELGGGETAAGGDVGVYAGGVGFQGGFGVGVEGGGGLGGAAAQAEDAHHAVVGQGDGAGDFGQFAGGGAAHQVHLEQALAGVQVAEDGGGVAQGGGADAGDGVFVEIYGGWGGEAGDGGAVAAGGEAVPEGGSDAACCEEQQDGDAAEPAGDQGSKAFFF